MRSTAGRVPLAGTAAPGAKKRSDKSQETQQNERHPKRFECRKGISAGTHCETGRRATHSPQLRSFNGPTFASYNDQTNA